MDKRAIIAFVLIGLILFFYGDYVKWVSPPPPPSLGDSTAALPDSMRPLTAPFAGTPVQHSGPGAILPVGGESALVPVVQSTTDSIAPIPDREVVVETERYHMVIASRGAQIKSLRLKPHGLYLRQGVELIPDAPGARPGYRFWTVDGVVETSALQFRLEDESETGDVRIEASGSQTDSLKLYAPLGKGRGVRIIYTFVGDKFNFLVNAEEVGEGNPWVRDYVEALWTGGLAYTEPDSGQARNSRASYQIAYTLFAGDALEELKLDPKKSVVTNPGTGQVRWGAVRTKYFMVAMLPETTPGVGSWMESRHDSTRVIVHPLNRLGFGIRLPLVAGVIATPVRVFIGPLDTKLLDSIDPTLTKTMNWGWAIIAPFSKAILWGLKALFSIIPNYGVCIIIFSILIKIIIWPLTKKSYTSMAAMQRVQPKIAEMKEKYKNDAPRLNKEMMKLYKEEKINPMGGCLPMLLQLPLLYAMYIIFSSTIEFRQAPFALWITDLSLPDYVYTLPFSLPMYGGSVAVLPILMAVSTYYQSKITMTDPNQKMMLYMMPVMMLLFMNGFPSGLTLYYTLLNVWTLVQQKITPMPGMAGRPLIKV